jgi:RNA polymerase sigma-70 factor, ECF subfamily
MALPPRSDAALLAAATLGDRSALAEVWQRHARLVRSIVHGALGPDTDTEDITQEVFVALLRGAKSIRNADALRGYLRGSALRLAAQELRRRRRIRRREELSPTGVLPDTAVAPLDVAERQAVAALFRVFSGLKPRQHSAFVLRRVHRVSWREIAEQLGISESTAKRDVTWVRALLGRSLLKEPALFDYLAQTAQRASVLRRISMPLSTMPNTSASVS